MFKLDKTVPLPVSSTQRVPTPAVAISRTDAGAASVAKTKTRWEERHDGEIVRVSEFDYRKTLACGCGSSYELYTSFEEVSNPRKCHKCSEEYRVVKTEELNNPETITRIEREARLTELVRLTEEMGGYTELNAQVSGGSEAQEAPVDVRENAPAPVEPPAPKPNALLDRIAALRAKAGLP